ncbi:MAG TPA: MBL fold metallo-hydrolase [Rariglobus sp.]|jgi:L-ascorbate metabolism protein UlaG (beta-lactamase superfamily)|nr:MBL fold metallo-hydrolase [Rariglobus sp.]
MPSASLHPVSDHCDGRLFFNPRRNVNRTLTELMRWKLGSKAARWPAIVPVVSSKPPIHTGGITATWINHSTFLLQTPLGNILTDPVYGERVGPGGLIGPRRTHAPGIAFADLPRIDLVLLSHDHYDHCDLPTLARLFKIHSPAAITPLGNGSLLRAAGWRADKITELDWWQSQVLTSELRITLTPSLHWSNRLRGPRNGRLWGGFFVEVAGTTAHFVGDTGYDKTLFMDIRARLGAPDLAMIPIGAYEPRWFMSGQHCDPKEAAQIHLDLGARLSLAMHWGTFQLTDEAREAPPKELAAALIEAGMAPDVFRALPPGESAYTTTVSAS